MAVTTLDQRMLGLGTTLTDHTIVAGDIISFADSGASNVIKRDTVQGVLDLVSAGFTLTAEQATTSGSGITFGSIPSGVQHVVMMVEGTSPGSDGDIYIQLGDGGGLETSGYIASGGYVLQVGTTGVTRSTSSFIWRMEGDPAWTYHGAMQFFLKDATNNTWVAVQGGSHGNTDRQATVGGGSKSLSAALTQIKVFPQNGAFDAGSISIMYM